MAEFKPALTVLLQQQQAAKGRTRDAHVALPPMLSPYRSKQAPKGLGRQQPAQYDKNRASAKGLLRSVSAAHLQPAQQHYQQQQQLQSPTRAPRSRRHTQQLAEQEPELWQADASQQLPLPSASVQLHPEQHVVETLAPSSSFQSALAAAPVSKVPSRAQSGSGLRSSASVGALLPAKPGESFEAQAYRSLPPHSQTGSHFYSPAPARGVNVHHRHEYADGSVVPECACERGRALEREQMPPELQALYATEQMTPPRGREEYKEQTPSGAAQRSLSPSQIARANIPYAKQRRRPDSSRQRSVYASSYVPQPVQHFSKLGKGYFASHNKSYIRACLQDPTWGLRENAAGGASDPKNQGSTADVLNFAAEVAQEHLDPSKRLVNLVPAAHLPTTTHHADFAAPSPELIKSYKRVGKDYRQSLNKSYIRYNLTDPSVVQLPPGELNSATPSHGVRVPFQARSTTADDFRDFSSHYRAIREDKARKIKFGAETGPHENIWQEWDDNMEP